MFKLIISEYKLTIIINTNNYFLDKNLVLSDIQDKKLIKEDI